MNKEMNSLPVSRFIERFHAETGWKGTVQVDSDDIYNCTVFASMPVLEEEYSVQLRGSDSLFSILLFIIAPFSVMEGKYVDTAMLFNFINRNREFQGRITLDDKGGICFEAQLHSEDAAPLKDMLYHLLDSGVALFEKHGHAIRAAARTTRPYEVIREEYVQKESECE